MFGDDSRNHDNECARGTSDLRFRAAQRGNKESRDDGAVQTCLRRHSGGDRKRHRQRKRNESHCYPGDQIGKEFVAIVVAQQEYRFWKPGFDGGCHAAFNPKLKMSMPILARSKPK